MPRICHTCVPRIIGVLVPCRMVWPVDEEISADRLIGLHSAQVLSQSTPWIAQEAGLFKKYDQSGSIDV